MLRQTIEKLMLRENLDRALCEKVLNEILDKQANPLQIAAFLVLLRAKPETTEEISAIVTVLRHKMMQVKTNVPVLDIVGTGGDGANTVNISTGSAILAASCGVKIAKHGNRAVSSLAGSADVLEALGLVIDLPPEKVSQSIEEIGIGFCFAPNFHAALRELRTLRKELNIPTTLNFIGPLLNPANANYFLMGVYDKALLPVMADVLMQTGNKHSLVVHGCGLDEISCAGPAEVLEVSATTIQKSTLNPEEFGFSRCTIGDLKGGNASDNATLMLETFKGKRGPIADTFIFNAAIAIWLYGLQPSIQEAIGLAKDHLYSGKALTLLQNWIEFSHA
jgi:anthranilate phosphoribosyltransferase